MQGKPSPTPGDPELRRRAESRIARLPSEGSAGRGGLESAADTQRLLHELQVHQVEMEMQNAEMQESRDRIEALLGRYTELYDFAPVGYFSLDAQSWIQEANLTGSALLGVERSRLLGRPLLQFVALPCQPVVRDFLNLLFSDAAEKVCEAGFVTAGGSPFWASLHGGSPVPLAGGKTACQVAVSDITSIKQGREAQRQLEALEAANRDLKTEISRRQAVQEALACSEQHQTRLLAQSHRLQEQLRSLSHRLLQAREEERKRISRELHDSIAQTLVGISVQLETLARNATLDPETLRQRIARTQQVVEESVNIVHRFAIELRPTSLDDLGLIVTLDAHLEQFTRQTGVRASLTTSPMANALDSDLSTALYRIIQAALVNVHEHAQASRVAVDLAMAGDSVHLTISDDGKSFEVEQMDAATKGSHLGLIGMRERTEMLGGQFAVESEPGKGTTIRARIPLAKGPTAGDATPSVP